MQMKKKMKKKGFILLPVIMGVIILGILGVGLTSLYTGTFSTLSAGKAASQAQNNAQIESEMIRVRGYDDAKAHDWQDMKAYLGDEEGEKWASKVEKVREEKDQENRNVKIMKVSVKKNGEIISRYSEEIPLVQGLDVYTKDEMDALLNQLHTEINNVNTDLQDLQDFKVSTNKNFATINKQIDQINKNLDTLSNRITAEEKARKNEDAAIRADIANKYSTIQTQITSLKDSLNDLKSVLNKEISDRKTADTNLKNDYTSKITNLANTVNTKYSYLETLIQGLKGRLDGNEFVKSKAKQNISLQYLQGAGESKKTIHAFVDGVDVPLSSQGNATSSDTFNLSVKVPDTPSGAAKKKLFDVSLAGDETKTYSIPASYGYGFIELSGGNYHDSVSGYVHDAKISVDHASSTVTIENESFGIGYEWSHGGSFTYPTTLNTTAYFIPYIKAHTETRTFTLKELLQLVVDNHISE